MALGLAGLTAGWLIGRRQRSDRPLLPSAATAAPDPLLVASPAAAEEQQGRSPGESAVLLLPCRPRFVDVAAPLGIRFQYMRGQTGKFWDPESMGGGLAWLDYDGDRRLDLYFVQGHQLPEDHSGRFANVLYRQTAGGRWQLVPRWAAPSDLGYGVGTAVGDLDNDGFDDIYITNFGPDAMYQNNGDGTFSNCTSAWGLGCPLWGSSPAFGDLDRDGDLDLYVTNYIQYDPSIRCGHPKTGPEYCGPEYFDAQQDVLYRNDGRGQFIDVTAEAGIVCPEGKGLGVLIADLIGSDGWPEIFVGNDRRPNFMFVRRGVRGRPSPSSASPLLFEEAGMKLGVALNGQGLREADMGIACGDYDEDGDLDLYVTHYYMEHDTLWQNRDSASFADVTHLVGLAIPTLRQLSWGTHFIDYDNDGWLDLFVTSGHINDKPPVPYAMHPQLLRNWGGQRRPASFTELSAVAGPYFTNRYVGRGSAMADFDRDGDLDLAVVHYDHPAAVLRNDTRSGNQAIGFRLVGRRSNRSAIGTRLRLTVPDASGRRRHLIRELVGGGSYLSHNSRELLVGLGTAQAVQQLQVRWPSGMVSSYGPLAAGRYWTIREGQGPSQAERFKAGAGGSIEQAQVAAEPSAR